MEPFIHLTGSAAPLLLANIDTDQIAPAQFLKSASRKGLGRVLFYFLRHDAAGTLKADFVLNRPEHAGASILVTGDNFGCGSSREHAPWALKDFGIRCIIAPSFADIFFANAALNGLLLVALPQPVIESLAAEAAIGEGEFDVDLEQQTVRAPSGTTHRFDIAPELKAKLLLGIDPIGESLLHAEEITAFERGRHPASPATRPSGV